MDKSAIQKYAIWARNELIKQIKQRAFQYGITAQGYGQEKAQAIGGRVLSADEQKQRRAFISRIKKSSFDQVVEEVAYTWFNRFIALRYMEVNDYLPSHIRVFTDLQGNFNPEILQKVLHLDLPGLDQDKVSELLNTNKREDLYRYLLLTQCNALNDLLPQMFEPLGSYTEMLLPNNILSPEGIIGRLVADIPQDNFKDAVQIMGWLYQYYNTEPKEAVFAGLKKNIKITKEKIPAATQLFTPDWIVRYMVENSLGRLWLESRPDSPLKTNWKYYLDEPEQEPEVAAKLKAMRAENALASPEDIKIIDPCMGSGHILVYAFDLLMQIYTSEGYSARDAAQLILEKNIYGLEIDRRAYQLAYFALMMKARQYSRRILRQGIKPQLYEPSGYADGTEYGSLIQVDKLEDKPKEPQGKLSMLDQNYLVQLNTWHFRRLLAQKYDVVVTNPPYMGSRGMGPAISGYLRKYYPKTKSDTFSAYIERCGLMAKPSGFVAMFTPYVWMFIKSYEKLRQNIYNTKNLTTLIQFEYSAFEEATVPVCSFVYRNRKTGEKGGYFRLVDFRGGMEVQRQKYLEAIDNPACGFFYTAAADNFAKIPGSPVAYWATERSISAYDAGKLFSQWGAAKSGIQTGDNDRFLKLWFEVRLNSIAFGMSSKDEYASTGRRWLPQIKGGEYRKWYGNFDYVINWLDDGAEIRSCPSCRLNAMANCKFYFVSGISWSHTTSGSFGARFLPSGYLFNVEAPSFFPCNIGLHYPLGFLNSKIAQYYLNYANETMHYLVGNIKKLPLIYDLVESKRIGILVTNNIMVSRDDWDSFETSWDFIHHPLINGQSTVAQAFNQWEKEAAERFYTLKANEEELNRIFIDIYGLQDELTPEVEEKDVTVRKADLERDIKSLISYAVGCMLGRYSLDVEGLAYAGGRWDAAKYESFAADEDNIIPISDDQYFEDDMAARFIDFIKTVYGEGSLEENLQFIAHALGGIGSPREIIRRYFLVQFYKDHVQIYKKRPIYWLFDSGRRNGFKALIYMHRYKSDLLARLRTDYVHEQQERYRTQLAHTRLALESASGAERARLLRQQTKLAGQAEELITFEEKVHHLADQNITIDLDDGVRNNYKIFADVLAKI